MLEGFQEKGFNVVRLESSGFSPLHFLADALHAADIHGVACKGTLFDQILKPDLIKSTAHYLSKPGLDLWLFTVSNGLNQQVAQRLAFELKFSEDVKNLPSKRLARLLQLIEECAIDIALSGLLCHQVPQVTHFGLTNAVDTTETLFDPVWIPGKIVVDHEVGTLQVDPFSSGIRGQ
jgi:hypothetical protein